MQTIILGGGCFWCTESVFLSLKGVQSVVSGYMGGEAATANYKAVCSGNSGHVEVIQIAFDETVLPLEVVLDVFFGTHDPTTRDRQGNDVGTQYRSVIYYFDDEQKLEAEKMIQSLKDEDLNIVTDLSPVPTFYPAEEYRQNYFAKNPTQGYCNFAIPPKLLKLSSKFSDLLK